MTHKHKHMITSRVFTAISLQFCLQRGGDVVTLDSVTYTIPVMLTREHVLTCQSSFFVKYMIDDTDLMIRFNRQLGYI